MFVRALVGICEAEGGRGIMLPNKDKIAASPYSVTAVSRQGRIHVPEVTAVCRVVCWLAQ